LDKINNERKGVVSSLVKEVKKTLEERYGNKIPAVIVLGNPEWRPSLLGLVANTCAEEFDRPTFFWGRDGGNVIKGSCRSEGKTSVVELMRASVPETFLQFGGHKHSGGFAVSNEEIHFLEKRLNEGAGKITPSETGSLTSENIIDSELSLDDVNDFLFNEINKLAPFGVGNHKPIFLFRDIKPFSVRKFGKGDDHIEFVFKKKFGQKISAIAFFGVKEKWANKILENDYNKNVEGKIDLIASVEKSMFRGRPEIRLRVVDVMIY
jgi:single-stranded-DNA-specific exonuclease